MFFLRKPFDRTDWYFVVGSDTNHVFSSGRASLVSTGDETYVAWLASRGVPQPVHSFAELYDFLDREGMLTDAIETALSETGQLTPTQNYTARLAGGLTITSQSSPAISGRYTISDSRQFDIMGVVLGILAGQGFPGGVEEFPWYDADGNAHQFTADDFVLFATAVRDYVAELRAAAASTDPAVAWPATSVSLP
jgi:hypothetical protein